MPNTLVQQGVCVTTAGTDPGSVRGSEVREVRGGAGFGSHRANRPRERFWLLPPGGGKLLKGFQQKSETS